MATRASYGQALVKLGKTCDRVIALDGDMKNSTHSQDYKKAFPDRFIECYIAEQNMVKTLAVFALFQQRENIFRNQQCLGFNDCAQLEKPKCVLNVDLLID